MSKRAEERGLEALPPRWRKTKDGKGKVDGALPVRKFYIRAYKQAEKDLVEFISIVKQMRYAQAEFRRTRIAGWDYAAQKCEKKVDELIKKFEDDTENKH